MKQIKSRPQVLRREKSQATGKTTHRAQDLAGSAGLDRSLPAACRRKTRYQTVRIPRRRLPARTARTSHRCCLLSPYPCQVVMKSQNPCPVGAQLTALGLEGSRGLRVYLLYPLSSTPNLVSCLLHLPWKEQFLSTTHLRFLGYQLPA